MRTGERVLTAKAPRSRHEAPEEGFYLKQRETLLLTGLQCRAVWACIGITVGCPIQI